MTLTFIGRDNIPTYIALSTDVSAGKIAGATTIGETVFLTDTDEWKIVLDDLTLDDFIPPSTPSTDNGEFWSSSRGVSSAAVVSADISSGANITDAPTTDEKIVLTDIIFSTDTEMSIVFSEETSGAVLFKIFLPANGVGQITPRSKTKLAVANKKIVATGSVAGNVGITTYYYSEA